MGLWLFPLCLSDIEAVLVLNDVCRCAVPSEAASVGIRVLMIGACVTPAIWSVALEACSSALSFVSATSLNWWKEMQLFPLFQDKILKPSNVKGWGYKAEDKYPQQNEPAGFFFKQILNYFFTGILLAQVGTQIFAE